ncbi:MAG: hypothetical protein AMR96_03190 [Candidatus Adiutrix intracellularis]|nr:MAG: hypothetical protein AMR96_03190 [Candidatus Adiutrix intracellularis]MDR2826768.1 DNA repair protein RecN [Candidatus Adiutrix intracellularis]
MLIKLTVKNLAIIESLVINFAAGINILTGETGAGKSILVGALSLLMGRRGTADLVRIGADKAEIIGLFYLDKPKSLDPCLKVLGSTLTGEIILRRVLTTTGRSRAYVGDIPVTLSQLTVLGEELFSISGQHDQQALIKPGRLLDFLDRFGGHRDLLAEMRSARQNLTKAASKLSKIKAEFEEIEEKRDLYEYQRDEIKKLAPGPEEDLALLAEKNAAKDSGCLAENLIATAKSLNGEPGHVVEKLDHIRRHLEKAAALDSRLNVFLTIVDEAYYQLVDLSADLEIFNRNFTISSERLEWVDERLNALAKLKRKYGLSLGDIIERGRYLTETLNRLDRTGLDLVNMAREKAAALDKAVSAAQKLHQARQIASCGLVVLLVCNLKKLGFPEIEIEVTVEAPSKADDSEEVEKQISVNGFDRVNFLFSPNPGEGKSSLAKIVSGGELSRILLALKILENHPSDQLVVFDEIDAGLGGGVTGAVAESLATLANRQQLIVITHLPQVAALSGRHFVVAKETDPVTGRTLTTITRLSQAERAQELARMLGGTVPGPEALALADKMLVSAPDINADNSN